MEKTLDGIEADEVFKTRKVLDIALATTDSPITLDEATVGVSSAAKKSAGYENVMKPAGSMTVEGTNARVIKTFDFDVKRCADDMKNEKNDTLFAPKTISPEETPIEFAISVDVRTKIPSAYPLDIWPIVRPLIVTVNVVALIPTPPIMRVTEFWDVALHEKVVFCTLDAPEATKGTTPDAKNPLGYVKMIAPPMGTPVNGRKLTITGTEFFPAIRLIDDMLKRTFFGIDRIAGNVPVDPNPRMTPKCIKADLTFVKAD